MLGPTSHSTAYPARFLSPAEASAVQKQGAVYEWQVSAAKSWAQLLASAAASSSDPLHLCPPSPPGLRMQLLFSGHLLQLTYQEWALRLQRLVRRNDVRLLSCRRRPMPCQGRWPPLRGSCRLQTCLTRLLVPARTGQICL